MPRDIRPPTHRRTLPYPNVTSPSVTSPYGITHAHRPLTPPPTNNERRPSNAWSTQQDEQLLHARQKGMNWGPIARLFPDKSSNACRKRHERLQANRRDADEWDAAKTEALAKAYSDVRHEMWQMVADRMEGEKWSTVETKCMDKGLRNLLNLGKSATRRERNHQKAYSSDADDDSSRSHPNSDDGFNDSAIGPDEHHVGRSLEESSHLPHFFIGSSQQRRASHPPSGDHTPPSHFGGARSWSSSTSSMSPISAPILFPSEMNNSSPSSGRQQPRPKLPSFNDTFPSISSVIQSQQPQQRPVTTLG